jgi:GTP-binding protein YchF
MSLQIGIVGLPNVGKSTLFNALTRAGAAVAAYPFTTIEPNVGVVPVPDHRLYDIAAIVKPERIVPATIEFVDVAGLVKNAHQGEGLGNQFLGHIRNVDAIAMVVRCFHDPEVPHVSTELDPAGDIATVELELVLADLAVVERRIEKVQPTARSKPKEYAPDLAVLDKVRAGLNAGQPVHRLGLAPEESALLSEVALLTDKPLLYIANVNESDLPGGGSLADAVRRVATPEGVPVVVLCAECEAGLADWSEEDACAYRAELGLTEPVLDRLVQAGYKLLGLATFFTTTGGHEVRAWTVPEGTTVRTAAGKIHSDMEKGFIRAEVVSYHDLMRARTFAAARDKGVLRIEGRDYVVHDGDIVHVRFSPPG